MYLKEEEENFYFDNEYGCIVDRILICDKLFVYEFDYIEKLFECLKYGKVWVIRE